MEKSIRLFKKKILLSALATSFISVFSGTFLFPSLFKPYLNRINGGFLGIALLSILLVGVLLSLCTGILCVCLKDYKSGKIQISGILHSVKRLMVFFLFSLIIALLMSLFYGLLSQTIYSLAKRELHIDIIKEIVAIVTNTITLFFMPAFIFLFFSYMVTEITIKKSLYEIFKRGFRKYIELLAYCIVLFFCGYLMRLAIQEIEIQTVAITLQILILAILGTISIPIFAAECMKLKTVLKNGSKGVALVFTCSLLGMSMTTLAQEEVELISSAEASVGSEVLEESTEMESENESESVAAREAVLEVESATQEATEEVSQEEAVTETEIHSEVVERQEMSEDRNLREPLINWDFPGIEAYPSTDAPANITPPQARINSLISLSFDRTDKYSYSWRVLELINIERAKARLDILVMDEDLLEVAMKRGHEAAFSYSHIRPDGTLFWTAEQSTSIAQENIAIWYSTPEQAIYIWMNSPAYRADFLSDAYKSVGVGCFQMGEAYYWVLLFSQDESAITASKKIDQRVTATIAALTNTIHARINMTVSNVKEGHRITSSFLVYRTNSDYGVPIKLSEVDWASSNQGVGVIDSNGTIKGVKSGLTTITGVLKSNPSLFATREISVIPLAAVEQFVARFYTHILERV